MTFDTSTSPDLRVAVVGAGAMGGDHIARITSRIVGATVSAIVEPDHVRAHSAAEHAPGARVFTRIEDALEAGIVDAVLLRLLGSSMSRSCFPPWMQDFRFCARSHSRSTSSRRCASWGLSRLTIDRSSRSDSCGALIASTCR